MHYLNELKRPIGFKKYKNLQIWFSIVLGLILFSIPLGVILLKFGPSIPNILVGGLLAAPFLPIFRNFFDKISKLVIKKFKGSVEEHRYNTDPKIVSLKDKLMIDAAHKNLTDEALTDALYPYLTKNESLSQIKFFAETIRKKTLYLRLKDGIPDKVLQNIIKRYPNLQTLHLSEREIDITHLSSLINLKTLILCFCSIKNIGALFKLQTLKLIQCNIANTDALSNLINLQVLHLSGDDIPNIDALLLGLINLKTLSLIDNSLITNINALSELTNLQVLDLTGLKYITDVEPLSNLTKLKTLDLSLNRSIRKIEPISNLTNLQYLNLSGCWNITDVEPLFNLTNLLDLNLTGCCNITNLWPLSNLANLKTLNLGGCNITNIDALFRLINLQYLDLTGCDITNLDPLSNLPNLKTLRLVACRKIESFDFLYTLKNLKALFLPDQTLLKGWAEISKFLFEEEEKKLPVVVGEFRM